jgi:nicotinamidase-related amidase
VQSSPTLFVATPIIFTPDYRELSEPVGILKLIKETGAFKQGTLGAMTHRDLATLGDRVLEIPGKRGLNAFAETHLNETLRARGIKDVVLAGAVTSVCIDSTARSAHERGYRVTVLSDCTCGRTRVEEEFYCQQVFPLYAAVQTSGELVKELLPAGT